MKNNLLVILLFGFISCKKYPDKILIKKDGEWTMYINETKEIYRTHQLIYRLDTLDVRFLTLTNGEYKKTNSSNSYKPFTWSYIKGNFANPKELDIIGIDSNLNNNKYLIQIYKRKYEKWISESNFSFVATQSISTTIELKRK